LVISYALLGLGVVFHFTWMAFWLQPTVGRIVALLIVALALASLVHLRVWRQWRHWAPLTALVGFLAVLHHGFAFLWGGAQHTFSWIAIRYLCGPPPAEGGCGAMPSDNVIPALFADRLWNDQGTSLILGDWNGSDRPPLQSGAILLVRSTAGLLGVPDTAVGLAVPNTYWTFAASSLSQFLVLLAVVALVRALGLSNRAAFLTAVFVSVIPIGVFNLIYTWPKMLSAAYGLASVAVLVVAIRQRSRPAVPLAAAATLAVLATLAHGGGAFALPLFGGLALVLLVTQPAGQCSLLRGWVGPGLGALGTVALVTAPWLAYGTWADPSHGRLVKWHLAGFTSVDDRSFLTVLRESYGALSLREVVDARVTNLRSLLDPQASTYFAHDAPDWLIHWRLRDFFRPIATLGLGAILAFGHVLLTVVRLPQLRREGLTSASSSAALILWLSIASIVLWTVEMFGVGTAVVHQGSYIWLLVLAGVPFAFLGDRGRWGSLVAVCLLLAQTAYTATVYWSMAAQVAVGPTAPPPQVMATAALAAIAVGALGVIACVALAWRERPAAEVVLQP
jgi:hypothetical protein